MIFLVPLGTLLIVGGLSIGDGAPATQAYLGGPHGVAVAADGSLYIADTLNHRVRKVDPKGIITTVVGNGFAGYLGDGGPASHASLKMPVAVAARPDGSLYIADAGNDRVRRVDPAGTITTVAGDGRMGFAGDGVAAIQTSLHEPFGVALDANGILYIADEGNMRIRKLDPAGIITTVAGNGERDYSGDDGPAGGASLSNPNGVAIGTDGNLYIADTGNHRIRMVDAQGTITTVAGGGRLRDEPGDGGPATQATLVGPTGVALGDDGTLFIADEGDHRIRKVDRAGIITTVAGDGESGYSGDGGAAAQASLNWPRCVAVGPDGSLYIADSENPRVRKVDPAGIITTIAGTGERR